LRHIIVTTHLVFVSKGKVKQKYHRVRLDEVKLIHKEFSRGKILADWLQRWNVRVSRHHLTHYIYLYNNCKLN
jgi:hypothetical protein